MKKNVFIFWTERLNEFRGGVHRIIMLLLKYLPDKGFNVHYLYTLDDYHTFIEYNQDEEKEVRIGVENLRDYLVDNHCEIILGQDGVFSSSLTRLVEDMNIEGVKFVDEYHNSLLLYVKKLTRDYLLFEFKISKSLSQRIVIAFKYIIYPFWKKFVWRKVCRFYHYNLLHCDMNLFLTQKEIPIAESILHSGEKARCCAIANPLSWDIVEDESVLLKKRKEVLVVSRIYNPEKRIDLVLKIWYELQRRGVVNDWTLRIVGDGLHRELLMQMAKDLNLKNIIWEGWSDPKQFYLTSSIFMMTSACEGWGLTLTESMQTGTVPIAIDNYPALRDIISDGYDGFVVKNNDVKKYADLMQILILDKSYREEIAKNALKSSMRFSVEKIIDKWAFMLSEL